MKKNTGFKISLLGESTVGKTSIVNAYSKNQFSYNTVQTTGIVSVMKKKQFDNKEYKFKIFDTAGQERYKSLSNTTIQIADGFFMVFAVDNKESFYKIIDWINFIEDNVNLEEKALYLIANKIDVESEVRQVTKEEAEKFANSKNAKYFETSALKNEGINEAFEEIFKDIYQMHKQSNNRNSNFNLDMKNINNQNNKKKKFC
jgi:small GTP-binding protein